MMNTIHSTRKRQTALLLFLLFAATGALRAQLQSVPIASQISPAVRRTTSQTPARTHMTGSAGTRAVIDATLVVAPAAALKPNGPLELDLVPGNYRLYDNGVERHIDSFAAVNSPSSGAASPLAPATATPPGTFGLRAIPGTPQTPTTESLRAGNINLGALTAWVTRHAHAPKFRAPAATEDARIGEAKK